MKKKYYLILSLILSSDVIYSIITYDNLKTYSLFWIDIPFSLYIGVMITLSLLCFIFFIKKEKTKIN